MKTLQHLFFERALLEKQIEIKNLHIDHGTPLNFNNGIQYNLIFPNSFLTDIENLLPKEKDIDYLFIGTIKGPHREFLTKWNCKKSYISFNGKQFEHPRDNIEHPYYKQNYFNENYFKEMCRSKFVLAPGGCTPKFNTKRQAWDFLWTYRFWESVLCRCIPITDEPDPVWHNEYKFYKTNDIHVYRDDWVSHNLNTLINKHFL